MDIASKIAANVIGKLKRDGKDPEQWTNAQLEWFSKVDDNGKRIFSSPGYELSEDDYYEKQNMVGHWHSLR